MPGWTSSFVPPVFPPGEKEDALRDTLRSEGRGGVLDVDD